MVNLKFQVLQHQKIPTILKMVAVKSQALKHAANDHAALTRTQT